MARLPLLGTVIEAPSERTHSMKRYFPLFALALAPVLIASSCGDPDPYVKDGEHGYTAPPPATHGDLEDTAAYHQRNRDDRDTAMHSAPPHTDMDTSKVHPPQ